MGPVVSKGQYNIIQEYIEAGLKDGVSELIAGGPGRPEGLDKGWFVKPTVFVTTNQTAIGREEIFGPVLVMMGYDDVDHAVEIANDSTFGLAGYVNGADHAACVAIAKRMRTGWVNVNNGFDFHAPFGGYKRSGNGREWGDYGFHEYLEIKTILNGGV